MSEETAQTTAFWNNFLRALEAEPQEAETLRGASGIPQRVAGLALDRSRHRLIVATTEETELAAPFLQADLQAAFKSVQVLVVRALAVASALLEQDRQVGLCAFSLDRFSPAETESIRSGQDLDAVKEMLRRHHIFQYFFPAPDHLALGLIESGCARFLPQLIDQLVRTPDLGHPFGPHELMSAQYSFTEMVKELQNLGLVKDVEGGLEITDEGSRARAGVRDYPREGLLFKTLNRTSANLYLKGLLHPELRARRSS